MDFETRVALLQARITDEIFFALGLGREGWPRRVLGPLFGLPARRFALIAARFEEQVAQAGLRAGAFQLMADFNLTVDARGAEQIPLEGPLVLAFNHSGSYDSAVITSCIPRNDLSLVVSDVPFTHALVETSPHLIYVPDDTPGRMATLRASVAHLRAGGSLLIFPYGDVEPDPAVMTGAAATMADWSPSIAAMLRAVPTAQLQIGIASGMILPQFLRNPLIRLRRKPFHRQKMAEAFQILQQMVFPGNVRVHANVTFDAPIPAGALPAGEVMPAIIARAREVLADHCAYFLNPHKTQKPA